MADIPLIQVTPAGERPLLEFWKGLDAELSEPARHLLNVLARSLAERGWLPPPQKVLSQLVEGGENLQNLAKAMADLLRLRLVEMSPDRKSFTGFLGCISIARTPHRAHLGSGVNLFCWGGLDLLGLSTALARPVDAFSSCPVCQTAITLRVEDEAVVELNPTGVAAFQSQWDGSEPIPAVSARSPLFCGDTCLNAWTEAQGDPPGMPIPADLMLLIGAGLANAVGEARFALISG
ncbi:MAG: organomercurial lyase [Myxococcota bacterium]